MACLRWLSTHSEDVKHVRVVVAKWKARDVAVHVQQRVTVRVHHIVASAGLEVHYAGGGAKKQGSHQDPSDAHRSAGARRGERTEELDTARVLTLAEGALHGERLGSRHWSTHVWRLRLAARETEGLR